MFSTIIKNSTDACSKSFKLGEFFTKCPDYLPDNHLLDSRLISAAQIIRDFTDNPVYITSSFRTPRCNSRFGGAVNSYHLTGRAIDFTCQGYNLEIQRAILSKGNLYKSLRNLSINGFGFARNFIHIDVRATGSLYDPAFALGYDVWYYDSSR